MGLLGDQLIATEILEALRSGGRLFALYEKLSDDKQLELCRGLRKRGGGKIRSAKPFLKKVEARLKERSKLDEQVLIAWRDENTAVRLASGRWADVLALLFHAAERGERPHQAVWASSLKVLAGELPELEDWARDGLHTWWRASVAFWQCAMAQETIRLSFDTLRPVMTPDATDWFDQWRELTKKVKALDYTINFLIDKMWSRIREVYPETIGLRTAEFIFDVDARDQWIADLHAEMAIEPTPWISRYPDLLSLPDRLRPPAPARDMALLEEERAALQAAIDQGRWPKPAEVAAVLAVLWAILNDGLEIDALTDAQNDALDQLTRGFSRRVEHGQVALATDASADKAPPKKSTPKTATPKKSTSKKSTSKTAAPRKSPSKTAAPRKSPSKTAAPRKSPSKTAAPETPAPETPAPETPAPETPAPETPAPETPTPEAAAPETPTPETPTPETPTPEAPTPETPTPETAAPETPTPETAAPETATPETAAPETPHAALLIRLMQADRLPEAVHLARHADGGAPAWLIELVLLGRGMRPAFDGQTADRLRVLLDEVNTGLDDLSEPQLGMVLAALVRPALMAPHVNPMYALRGVAERCRPLADCATTLADFAQRAQPLPRELLEGIATQEEWAASLQTLADEAREWMRNAERKTMRYDLATRVWRAWIGPYGALRRTIEEALAGRLTETAAHAFVKDWEEGFSERLDEAAVKQGRPGSSIHSKVRTRLLRHRDEALAFIERACQLHRARPGQIGGDPSRQAQVLRALDQHVSAIQAQGPWPQGASAWHALAQAQLAGAFEEIVQRFGGMARAESPFRVLKRQALLIGDGGLDAVLAWIEAPRSVEAVIAARLKTHTPWLAWALVEFAPADAREALREEIEDAFDIERMRLQARLEQAQHHIEEAALMGVLDEPDVARLQGELDNHHRRVDEVDVLSDGLDLADGLAFCEALRGEIDEARQVQGAQLRQRLAQLRTHAPVTEELGAALSTLTDRIERAIDALDFAVADDGFATAQDWIRAGRPEPSRADERPAKGFVDLARQLPKLAGALDELPHTESRLKRQPALAGLSKQERVALVRIFKAWRDIATGGARQKTGVLARHLRVILVELGFRLSSGGKSIQEILPASAADWRRFEVIAELDDCILPRFGSKALSRHTVVVVWGDAAPRPAQWYADLPAASAITLLHIKTLTLKARRIVVHTLRGRRDRRCPLVIDPALVAWHFTLPPEERAVALQSAGAAGGIDNPYTPEAAGALAREMFFGRRGDIDDVLSPDGACLLYGGRQLGKSTLLQQVQRRHDPQREIFIRYRAVKHETDLWRVIRQVLLEAELIEDVGLTSDEAVMLAVRSMLLAAPRRRVLLLLDESDHLLDHDAYQRNFAGISLVRDLMTETGRRFKVVFAGLHSVQRFQRIPNQPLAHFGPPRCIRPMRRDAARALVREPFMALGYVFDPPDLIDRILAQTNRHPSLMQLFCKSLLDSMAQRQGSEKSNPPYLITDVDIRRVMQDTQLMDRMRERFDLTLDLDPRYRVIGYAVAALELMYEPGEHWSVHDLLDYLRGYWPAAFEGMGAVELRALLEELSGLGVLVNAQGCHRLRSPNVLRLLGDQVSIVRELEQWKQKPYAPMSDPQTVRRFSDGHASTLTLQQESILLNREHRVWWVCGSRALGIDRTPQVIEALFVRQADGCQVTRLVDPSAAAIVEALGDGQVRVIVSRQALEPARYIETIDAASRFVEELAPDRVAQVVFLVDVATRLTATQIPERRVCLRRWRPAGLKQHLEELHRPHRLDEWMQQTSGWPLLVQRLIAEAPIEPGSLLAASGLSAPTLRPIIDALVEFGEPIEVDDLAALLSRSMAEIQPLIEVLDDLHLVDLSGSRISAAPGLRQAMST